MARSRQRPGVVSDDRAEQQLDLRLAERLGDALGHPGSLHVAGRIEGRAPLVKTEGVQTADRGEGAGPRGGRAARRGERRRGTPRRRRG